MYYGSARLLKPCMSKRAQNLAVPVLDRVAILEVVVLVARALGVRRRRMYLVTDAKLKEIALRPRHGENCFIRDLIDAERCLRDVQHLVVQTVRCVGLRLFWRSNDTLCDHHQRWRLRWSCDERALLYPRHACADC